MRRMMAILLATAMFLNGCSNVSSKDETKLQTEHDLEVSTEGEANVQTESGVTDGADAETNTEEKCESTENAVENTKNANENGKLPIVNPILKEEIVNSLWVLILQTMERFASDSNGADCWERTYEVEIHLKEFDLSKTHYIFRLIYPNKKMNTVDIYWPDNIKDVEKYYDRADEYLQVYLADERDYQPQSSWITYARRESIMQIKGVIKNESYEQSGLFVDHLDPYTYYSLWGSVLKVAGEHYLEYAENVLGRFSGKLYMTNFDFETLTGTFWICVDDINPIEVTMRFHNQDCYAYFLEVNDTVWTDSVSDNAWIGLSFDLETTEMN